MKNRVKRWLVQNGLGLLIASAVGVGSVLGYQHWQEHQVNQKTDAAGRYQKLVELAATDFSNEDTDVDFKRLITVADGLRQAHPDSNYAAIGAGIVAAQAVERGDFDLAVSQLILAEAQLELPELRAMVSLRLAQLELELGQADAALRRVRGMSDRYFSGSRSELEGDILVAMDRLIEARDAYSRAHTSLTEAGLNTAVIDLKLSSLPEG